MAEQHPRPKRLLYVVSAPWFFMSHRFHIAERAAAAGYDIHVATPRGRRSEEIVRAGFTWHPLHMRATSRNPLREAAAVIELARLYRRVRPDMVHHVTPKPVIYGTIAARITGVPAVVNAVSGLGHVFNYDATRPSLLQRTVEFAYGVALAHPHSHAIFQNIEQQTLFFERGWADAHQATLIRGSGVDLGEFKPTDRSRHARPTVMFAGRMIKAKGVLDFIEAARQLADEGIDARFVLVGQPEDANRGGFTAQELDDLARANGLEYWGRRDDMPAVFAEVDVVCLPTFYPEGVPKTLIEAAACGLPSITTDVPGCRDIVRNEQNGLIVPIRDVPRLADAIRRLVQDRALRERMGAAGRAFAEAEFSSESVADEHMAIYRRLASAIHD